ncbi:hypothetical protein ACFWPP_25865 [Streptomyces anulatus]|uniref:hypothetical protein n=1 Tax=Streptomyces TaxID=1883 RepID=UPI000938B266|nr:MULTISPECIES: hypothetical protein [unclassified Streptomyces]OKJ11073.1 hypothetical protein AMK20_15515 [Streptomyces sp. TSRI0261]QNQ33920.1 hypothetical protein HYC88_09545 [Streptomyces sp. CB00271]
MTLPYLLLDIDGVLIPFPAADGSTPPTHVRHTVLPTGRHPDDPVPIWLDPSHGCMLTDLLTSGLVTPVWCTSWRRDATTIIGPLLGLPDFPYHDLPRPLDHDWAAERTAGGTPTLIVQPDPHLGLQPEHLTEVTKWLAQLPTARAV